MIVLESFREAVTAFNDGVAHSRQGDLIIPFVPRKNAEAIVTAFSAAGAPWPGPVGFIDERTTEPLFSTAQKARFVAIRALAPFIRVEDCSNGKSRWMAWIDRIADDRHRSRALSTEGASQGEAVAALVDKVIECMGGAENLTRYPAIPFQDRKLKPEVGFS